jgi:hypothetical protein
MKMYWEDPSIGLLLGCPNGYQTCIIFSDKSHIVGYYCYLVDC